MANSEPSWDRDADVESLCLIRSTFSGYIPAADTPVDERPFQGRVTNQLTNGLQPRWSSLELQRLPLGLGPYPMPSSAGLKRRSSTLLKVRLARHQRTEDRDTVEEPAGTPARWL